MNEKTSTSYWELESTLRDQFVHREVSREINSVLWIQIFAIVAINSCLTVADVILGIPELRSINLFIRGSTILAAVVIFPILRDKPLLHRNAIFMICQIFGIGFSYSVHQKHALNLPLNGYLSEYILIIQMMLIIGFCPFTQKKHLLSLAGIYLLVVLWAVSPVIATHALFVVLAGCSFYISVTIRVLYLNFLERLHGIDYDLRARMLPPILVRNTLDRPRGFLIDAVKMSSTGILCITSDWHHFKDAFKLHDEQTIAKLMSDYYDECVTLLHEKFDGGDCALDWMGDDVLIYIPYNTQDDQETETKTLAAVNFALDLVQIRKRHFAHLSVPSGIDVAISLGRANYGLSGTSNSRRMIAFGYPVSLARGLQHHIKICSELTNDNTDRIAMTNDIRNILSNGHDPTLQSLNLVSIKPDQFLKNMQVTEYFVHLPT
ncbi:MAG: hypothetical protein NT027_16895 [Proteobacteria bacterium]|nr:hypothetical protein [Pseudomonadota bacterium]